MRVLLFVCFSIFTVSIVAQKPIDIVKKMMAVYDKTNSYAVDMKYNLYKGVSSGVVEESYNGFLYKNKKNIYQKISETDFILTPSFCAKVVHSEKVVELLTGQESPSQELDIKTILKECSSFTSVEQENYYLITMVISHVSQIEFEKVLLKIYKKNMHLAQVDLFYSVQQNFSKNPNKPELQKPHLRILYSNFTTSPKISNSVFEYDTYFKVNKTIITLSKQFEKYEFIDSRI